MQAMELGLAGKRVLVTGASRGIGAAAARAFAAAGCRLALHHRGEPGEAAAHADAALVQGDFGSMEEVRRVVAKAVAALGGLDVLVNNAGHMLGRIPLAAMTDEDLDRVFDLNARSVVVACRAALPALAASGGSIINVTSISARTGGSPDSSLYSASKAFVATFTRSLAVELAPQETRVNAVSPETIRTRFHEVYSSPEKLEATRRTVPLQRLG